MLASIFQADPPTITVNQSCWPTAPTWSTELDQVVVARIGELLLPDLDEAAVGGQSAVPPLVIETAEHGAVSCPSVWGDSGQRVVEDRGRSCPGFG
jgi:hypothetical protein